MADQGGRTRLAPPPAEGGLPEPPPPLPEANSRTRRKQRQRQRQRDRLKTELGQAMGQRDRALRDRDTLAQVLEAHGFIVDRTRPGRWYVAGREPRTAA